MGVQWAGEVCFNPSRCVHAVRNVGAPGETTVSLTHNFVDGTNLADALADATRSIQRDLLPMARALTPKKTLKTLAASLGLTTYEVAATLGAMPDLLTPSAVEDVVRAAARGAADDDDDDDDAPRVAAVERLLRAELSERLEEVRRPFVDAATQLRDALRIQAPVGGLLCESPPDDASALSAVDVRKELKAALSARDAEKIHTHGPTKIKTSDGVEWAVTCQHEWGEDERDEWHLAACAGDAKKVAFVIMGSLPE